ncbi:hypothetical protein B9Z55_025337 [Caenorhabditis nigoni]|uniref:Uncharacterized protein n=1 Tax=Caenorhabditis nigoni TaxID=1611254 RepID=A0A2G5SYE5_9PELO|nr:hypothetical protein B9Z55_025337 [Caenorhabditis nigoni]
MPKITERKLPTSGGYKVLLEMKDDESFPFNSVGPGKIAYKHTIIEGTAEKKAIWQKDPQLKEAFERLENAEEGVTVFVLNPQNFAVRLSPNLGLFSVSFEIIYFLNNVFFLKFAALQVMEDGLVIHWPVTNKDDNMEVDEEGTERDQSQEAEPMQEEEEEGGDNSVASSSATGVADGGSELENLKRELLAAKEELARTTKLHQSLIAEKKELDLNNLKNQAKIRELEDQHRLDRKEVEDLKKMIAEKTKENDALRAANVEAQKYMEMAQNSLKQSPSLKQEPRQQ